MMACQCSVNYKIGVFILCLLWLTVGWKSLRILYNVDGDRRDCRVAVYMHIVVLNAVLSVVIVGYV